MHNFETLCRFVRCGEYIRENYYNEKNVIYEGSSGILEWGWYRGPSLIDGGNPVVRFKIVSGGYGNNNSHDNYMQLLNHKVAWDSAAPTAGSWRAGDVIWNTAPAAGGATPNGWRCVSTGTFSTIAPAVTGSITSGLKVLVVSAADDFTVGDYITVAGVTGPLMIYKISGTTLTLDIAADATVVGAAVDTTDPTFASMGVLP